MKTYIALLRGINVGGKNVLPMKELRKTLADIGLYNVRTYIQSGNVVFESAQKDENVIASNIRETIQRIHGFAPFTLVVTKKALEAALEKNPYSSRNVEPKFIHFYFLSAAPDDDAVEKARALVKGSEEVAVIGKVFYLFAPEGVARSKLASGAERALGVSATARNLRSVTKILELASKNAA